MLQKFDPQLVKPQLLLQTEGRVSAAISVDFLKFSKIGIKAHTCSGCLCYARESPLGYMHAGVYRVAHICDLPHACPTTFVRVCVCVCI